MIRVRTIVLTVLATCWFGCVESPDHGEQIANRTSPVLFLGARPEPSQFSVIQYYDWSTATWNNFDLLASSSTQLTFYPGTWYSFYRPDVIIPSGAWLLEVGDNGNLLSAPGKARVRVRENTNGEYLVLPDGYSACASQYSRLEDALTSCGPVGDQRFSDVFAAGYSDSDYARYPVRVRRHPQAPGLTTALADEALLTASVIMQVEDPGPSGSSSNTDHACPVIYERSGAVATLSTAGAGADPDGIFDSGSRSWYLDQGAPGVITLILVKQIVDCGDGSGGGTTFGCGFATSNVVIMTDTGFPQADRPELGPLWAHELMHTFVGPWNHNVPAGELRSNRSLSAARWVRESDCNNVLAGITSL